MGTTRKLTYSFYPEAEVNRRLTELVLYIASKLQYDTKYGVTKLNKVLFFSDFFAYKRFGKSISGSHYMRNDFGPVPQKMKPILERMKKRDIAEQRISLSSGLERHCYLPLRDSDLSVFTGEEIAVVDGVIEMLWPYTGSEVSILSHDRVWRAIPNKGLIPYEAAFISEEGITDRDLAIADTLAKKHGWVS